MDELEATCTRIVDFPRSGVDRSEIRVGLRSKPYGSYVIFSVGDPVVRIERIVHGARDLGAILPSN